MSANIFAVIHSRQASEAIQNAECAVEQGCDGVFFISHGALSASRILDIAKTFKQTPFRVAGVNFLDMNFTDGLAECWADVDMFWSDVTPVGQEREVIEEMREDGLWSTNLYGGVAFKYQPQPRDLFEAAEEVRGFIDVLTTSGEGTGKPPELGKLELLASGFGKKIAVTSGVDASNAAAMLPYVDHFLVASSICSDFYTIDRDKCKALVDAIRSAE